MASHQTVLQSPTTMGRSVVSSRRIPGLLSALACSLSVAVFVAADVAQGHIENSTAGITSDYYTPAHEGSVHLRSGQLFAT